jgi:hypothetical protein
MARQCELGELAEAGEAQLAMKKGAEMRALPRSRLHSLPVQAILPPLRNLPIQRLMPWLDLNQKGEGMDWGLKA